MLGSYNLKTNKKTGVLADSYTYTDNSRRSFVKSIHGQYLVLDTVSDERLLAPYTLPLSLMAIELTILINWDTFLGSYIQLFTTI